MTDASNPIGPAVEGYVQWWLQRLRDEFTVMPRFAYHQPLDYNLTTFPPEFEPAIVRPGEPVALPPPAERMGYSADDDEYLNWGRYDHDLILRRIEAHDGGLKQGAGIMDFGCSSGRVLRHFHREHEERGWKLLGVDIQARPIEWMRQNFPQHFAVFVGTVLPHLPLEDNSLDYIFGFSVFTHIKFLWDTWLLELRRVLKPGGLLLQTIHAEVAWRYYYEHRDEEFIRTGQPEAVRAAAEMNLPFLYHGDIGVSQVFWKREVARQYWGRYFEVLEIYDPAARYSFQDMIVCRKAG
jgi:SAM-dependent methyltransferase